MCDEMQACDVCGKPSVEVTQHIRDITQPGDEWRSRESVWPFTYRCADHPDTEPLIINEPEYHDEYKYQYPEYHQSR